MGFGASVANQVALAIETGDEHRTAMIITPRLVVGNDGWLSPFRGYVPQTFTKTAATELRRAAEELD
jgi:2-polyprenyl-6-methoxyphenol hydroxylase-like FAD-dependent oxidoreductase